MSASADPSLRRAAGWAAALNLAWFGVEFVVARAIGSVALFADSIDFLEDASLNGLVLLALGWGPRRRGALGLVLAVILLVPAVATLWTAWGKLVAPLPPAAVPLSSTALGALAVNLICAFLLARVRHAAGSLSQAAFLSARNDVLANVAMILAGVVTLFWRSALPDLLVGLGILIMNLDAARKVYRVAREELRPG